MGLFDRFEATFKKTLTSSKDTLNNYVDWGQPQANGFFNHLSNQIGKGNSSAKMVESILTKAASQSATSSGAIGVNDFGIKGKRQYIADRRYLIDLYVVALNNVDIRTATTHLRNEIFRRGIEFEPSFDYKCDGCSREFSSTEARKTKGTCPDCQFMKNEAGELIDAQGKPVPLFVNEAGELMAQYAPAPAMLRKPDDAQIKPLKKILSRANYFGQSLESVLRECEDDINVVDDGFIYCRKRYTITSEEEAKSLTGEEPKVEEELLAAFRLDPALVEIAFDYKGRPGLRFHVCLFHRDNLLEVNPDEDWELDWQGKCPICDLKTRPVYYKYNEQYLQGGYGAAQNKVLYLTEDEIIHWSRYTPTETYGYPPLLTIYEQALTLIGMNRYLYDYFYERRVPQGVVTVVTDNVEGFNATKAEVEARMQQDPHYIPWMAISSKSGQGKMEFVRFAYSLDELNYLPVRDEIRERISGLYGVSSIWMASNAGTGGLNNETQQLTVMSRVVEGAQRSYLTDVFPKLERALGVTDWKLVVKVPEETDELAEIQIDSAKAGVAEQFAQMGFGVKWDAEAKEFTFSGEVKSAEDQQKMMAGPIAAQQGSNPLPPVGQEPQEEAPAPPGESNEGNDVNDDPAE